MKHFLRTALLVLGLATPAAAQLNLTYTSFQPGQTISSAQFTANFTAISANALNRTGGTMTGTLTLNGAVDINSTLTVGSSNVQPFDATGNILETAIADGALLARLAANETVAGTWTFSVAPVMSGASITSATIPETSIADGTVYPRSGSTETIAGTWSFTNATITNATITDLVCTGCVGATELAATAVTLGTYGNASTSVVGSLIVDADGRLTSATATNVSAFTIAETQITDGTTLARVGGTESITGSWTFSGTTTAFTGTTFSVDVTADIVVGTSEGADYVDLVWHGNYLSGGAPALEVQAFDASVLTTPLLVGPGYVRVMTLYPSVDNTYTLGTSATRFVNINLALPNNLDPTYVVVNKGGGGGDANSALGYIAGYTGSKLVGNGCTLVIDAGIITNVTGC